MRILDMKAAKPFKHSDTYKKAETRPDFLCEQDIIDAIQDAGSSDGLKALPKFSGVYLIANTKTGRIYIGRSENLRARVGVHFSLLRNGKHTCFLLQRDFDEMGESSFKASTLTLCRGGWMYLCEHKALKLALAFDTYNVQNVDYLGRANLSKAATSKVSDCLMIEAAARRSAWIGEVGIGSEINA